jgi:hypothetical protein
VTTTFKVRFWEIADWAKSKDKKKKKGRPYGVRWVTERKSHSEWYATKALANSRRSELMQAAREGEPFDVESGLPVTELKGGTRCPSSSSRSPTWTSNGRMRRPRRAPAPWMR